MRPKRWLLLALALCWAGAIAAQIRAETEVTTVKSQGRKAVFSEGEIRDRLKAIAPLQMRAHAVGDGAIKSHVLCFCLHKGPQMVRELRQQAAVWFQKGLVALQAHDGVTAADAFTKVIQLNPRDALAYMNRGLAYSQTGDFVKAHSDLSGSLDIDSRQSVAYYARGLIALLLGQPAEAKHDLRRAKDLGDARARAVLETLLAT